MNDTTLVPTKLQLTDTSIKWGLVTFFRADGSIERQHTISGADHDAARKSDSGVPKGCTDEEWHSHRRVTVYAADGLIDRQYTLTGEDAAIYRGGDGKPSGGKTAGCTQEEYDEKRVSVRAVVELGGFPHNIGQATVQPNDFLCVPFGLQRSDQKISLLEVVIPPDEWALIDGVVHINKLVVDDYKLDAPFQEVHQE